MPFLFAFSVLAWMYKEKNFLKYKNLFLYLLFGAVFVSIVAYFNLTRLGLNLTIKQLTVPVMIGLLVGFLLFLVQQKNKKSIISQKDRELESISNSVMDVIFMLSKSGKMLYVNKAMEDLFGYKSEEVLGTNIITYIPRSEISRYRSQMKDVFQNKEVHHFESYIKAKNGMALY